MLRRLSPKVIHWTCGLAVGFAGVALEAGEAPRGSAALPLETIELADELLEETAAVADPTAEAEVIRERYADGKVKIERHVSQDIEGNYLNHGPWTLWDEQGRLIGGGEYRNGQRNGAWVRYFSDHSAQVVSTQHGRQFQPPFTAEAGFENGKLHGIWTIADGQNRPLFAWKYENGVRQGKSIWFYPNGQKWMEIDYKNGEIDGEYVEYGPDQKVVVKQVYQAGRRLGTKVEFHANKAKKLEGNFLFAREILESKEDFWAGVSEIKSKGKDGEDVKHGSWASWHSNGQQAMEGHYERGVPAGKFTWWHANGQKALEGNYGEGLQDGKWVWWHANGQKQIQGDYVQGGQIGKWTWWTTEGKVVESAVFSDADAPMLAQPAREGVNEPTLAPPLMAPTPAEARTAQAPEKLDDPTPTLKR